MNVNFHLDDKSAKKLDRVAKALGEMHSGLIRRALRVWLDRKTHGSLGWPPEVLEWQGISEIASFESHRGQLLPSDEESLL